MNNFPDPEKISNIEALELANAVRTCRIAEETTGRWVSDFEIGMEIATAGCNSMETVFYFWHHALEMRDSA